MSTSRNKVIHFYSRAGFGIPAEYYFDNRSLEEHINLQHSNKDKIHLFSIKSINNPTRGMSAEEKKVLRQESRLQAKRWFNLMVNAKETALVEKTSLFWHGHLACRVRLGQKVAADYINAVRKNALGSYKDLILSVSKTAAMVRYLNNQQNKKTSPNENFAREVLELFTIGHGNYTEQDIKEAARAFTGWSSNLKGEFVFRKYWHDTEEKTFMGETGNFTGEDIIDIILSKKQTADFLVEKIYKFYVSEDLDRKRINDLSIIFYNSGYDISYLLRSIFESDWFYDVSIMSTQIKSPIQLMANLFQLSNGEITTNRKFAQITSVLGQRLLDPPNVAGWPGGKSWIDNASLSIRMNLGLATLNEDLRKKLDVKSDTSSLFEAFQRSSEDISNDLSMILLNKPLPVHLNKYVIKKKMEKKEFNQLFAAITSQLEYQMC